MEFIPNSKLLHKTNSTTGDYHRQMNSKTSEKWTEEKVLSNLPGNAVVVINNTSYHSVQ